MASIFNEVFGIVATLLTFDMGKLAEFGPRGFVAKGQPRLSIRSVEGVEVSFPNDPTMKEALARHLKAGKGTLTVATRIKDPEGQYPKAWLDTPSDLGPVNGGAPFAADGNGATPTKGTEAL